MYKISKVYGRLVLDSRGNPTIAAYAETKNLKEKALVPSGASTGKYEAIELRDNDKRYHGKNVSQAILNIKKINTAIKGMDVRYPKEIDNAMLKLDGTKNKSNLGANAMLGVSMAVTRLQAKATNIPLYQAISERAKTTPALPLPFSNIINGGVHAGNDLAMQEFMIVPVKAKRFSDAARMVSEVYHTLKKILAEQYGKQATAVGDEGGFAPPISTAEEALNLLTKAIKVQGYTGKVKIALDPAASEFYYRRKYQLDQNLSAEELIDYYTHLVDTYPIVSLEDPFDQDDFRSFTTFTKKNASKIQIVGDDLLVTNITRIKKALKYKLCNALLLKINQIGTISESINAARLALDNGWHVMVSHRSGETEDTFIADLAVGLGIGQIKLGAPCRGERTSKYNRLMEIEAENHIKLLPTQFR